MHKKINIVLIGYGFLGEYHLEKIQHFSLVNLVAVIDRSPIRRKILMKKFPNIRGSDNLNEVMDKIDAALVVTITSSHYTIVKKLLEAGKHVFCEKPFTETLSQAKELELIAHKKHCILQVGHSERYHRCWKTLFKTFFLKEARMIFFRRTALFKGRGLDVDVLSDLMIHDLDLLRYFFPKNHIIYQNSSGVRMQNDLLDSVYAEFKVEGGPRVYFTAGRFAVRELREVELISKKGSILFDLIACTIKEFDLNIAKVVETNYIKQDHLLLEHREFYDCISKGRQPLVDGREGLHAIELLETIRDHLQ